MKISKRDWVQLSSYVDGELNSQELKKIEERLDQEPGFQLALEELRQTKTILQQTPKLRVPRNFFLTPALVGIKARHHPARGYRLVSALMTFLLVGVLVIDIGRGFINMGTMAPAAPRELMLEVVSDSAAEAIEEPALVEAGEEMAADNDAPETEVEAEAREEEVPAPALAAEAPEEGESVGFAEETQGKSTGEATADAAANQADDWQEDEVVEEQIIPSQTNTPESSGTPVPSQPTSAYIPEEEIHQVESIPSIDPFRILEVILGFGALIFGITAWVIRRRKS